MSIAKFFKITNLFELMRVAYINPTILLKRPISELAKCLSEDNKISIFIPRNIFKKPDQSLHYSKLPKKIQIISYPTINLPLVYNWPIPISPTFFIKLFRLFRENDIIHMWTYSYLVNFISLIYSKILRQKLILTFDTVPGESFSLGRILDSAFKTYHSVFNKFIFKTPKFTTVYGKSIAKYARKIGAKNLKKNPTGTNQKLKKKTKSIRKEFKINKKTKLILFVGSISRRKGVDTIISTISKLKFENTITLLVGGGPELKKFKNKVRKLNLKDRIIFTGPRKDVQNFYSEADIFFFPSRGEGMPGAVMEAMSYELPILTSNIPGTKDLVDKTSAILTKNYISKLRSLITDKNLRKKLGKSAKRRVKNHSWEKISKEYAKLYSSVK